MKKLEDNHVTVIYDFKYTAKDGRLITVKQGEKLYLINKTNCDWWQVIRSCEERPFFVPAGYVKEPTKHHEAAEYQNLDFLKKIDEEGRKPSKPVPKARTQVQGSRRATDDMASDKKTDNDSDSSLGSDRVAAIADNRMRNSYHLNTGKNFDCPKIERKQSVPLQKRKPLENSKNLSKSLEKLAQEIKFEPKLRTDEAMGNSISKKKPEISKNKELKEVIEKSEKEAKNFENKAAKNDKTEDKGFFRGSLRGKSKDANVILGEKTQSTPAARKQNMRGKTSDASMILSDRKPPAKSRGLFSSFKRKKQAFVLSSSWEGLDKISEIADKPMVTAFGLQRSKTFMTPEKPKPRTRLDAYNEKVWTYSSFKPNDVTRLAAAPEVSPVTLPSDVTSDGEGDLEEKSLPVVTSPRQSSVESVLSSAGGESDGGKRPSLAPFSTRKASLVRNRRVDTSKVRLRVPATPPPDESPVRELGDGWGEYQSSDGRPFFYNRVSGERNLKPPRKFSNLQFGGSKDSISSDLSSPVRSSPSPSPKFSSGTSLDRLTPTGSSGYPSRLSLDRLTPIDIPPLATEEQTTPLSSPPYPSDRRSPFDGPPSDGEGLELTDHVRVKNSSRLAEVVPEGWVETFEKTKNGEKKRVFVHVKTNQKTIRCADEPYEDVVVYRQPLNVSSLSLYDNVNYEDEEGEGIYEWIDICPPPPPPPPPPPLRGDSLPGPSVKRQPRLETIPEEDFEFDDVFYGDMPITWYAAHDEEDRVYFYHENSNVSRWKLPDLPDPPKDGTVSSHGGGESYNIQRSATESAIPPEKSDATRLRRSGEKDARGRASKTQSMILDGKVDVSRDPGKSIVRSSQHPLLKGCRRSGVLHRAKILEQGKKLRKHWMSTFAVLCDSAIFFFKDEKTFLQFQKNGATVSQREYVCNELAGAVIEAGGKISGRKNVYKILWADSGTEVLIQTEKKTDAEEWLTAIQSVIDYFPKVRKDSSSSAEPSSPTKVSRSKSVKTKIKGAGSIEDLSAAGSGDSKNKISELLKKFILRRPSSDSLRQKGILRDEPVFGCSLEQITQNRAPRVPEFVERCIRIIESSEENMKTDGLYRASGNLSQVQKIRLEVDQNKLDGLEHEEDVHVLTGSLKLFFRELREPLIPFPLFERSLEACRKTNPKQKVKELKKIMECLPVANRDTLRFLLEHLRNVQRYKEFNRMDISNLAIVFGPSLMWPAEDSLNMAMDLMQQNRVIEVLLTEFEAIFPPTQ